MEPFKVVALSNLNLREGPGEAFEICDIIPSGYPMTITELAKDGGGHRWYKTNINNGWVKAVYVSQPNMTDDKVRSNDRSTAGLIPTFTVGGGIGGAIGNGISGALGGLGVAGAALNAITGGGSADSQATRILRRRIYGVPHQFIEATDGRGKDTGPFGLEFLTNIMSETPILSVLPGIPDYLSEMEPEKKLELTKDLTKAINDAATVAQIDALNARDDLDMKFFEFQPRCMEYMTYVNVLCRVCAIYMGLGDKPVPGYGSTGTLGLTGMLSNMANNPVEGLRDAANGANKTAYGTFNWFRWHLSNAYAGQVAAGGDFTDFGAGIADTLGGLGNVFKNSETMKAYNKTASDLANSIGKDTTNGLVGAINGQGKVMKDEDSSMNQLDQSSGSRVYMDSYYIDFFVKPPSYSETFSNQTNQSMFAGAIQSASNMAKELQFFMGGAMSLETGKFNEQIGDYNKNVNQLIQKSGQGETVKKILSSLITGSTSVITGANLIFPEIWESSSYNRDFSMEITLATPYGTRESIYLNIIVPLMHILALVLPRQSTVNSYSAPFLVRCSVPGFFSCDMGIVRDVTISKGGASGDSWSKDGLPTEVTVTINIADLYNALSMSNYRSGRSIWNFMWNVPLLDYLGVVSGINMRSSNMMKKFDIINLLSGNVVSDQIDYTLGSAGEQAAAARTRILAGRG